MDFSDPLVSPAFCFVLNRGKRQRDTKREGSRAGERQGRREGRREGEKEDRHSNTTPSFVKLPPAGTPKQRPRTGAT